MTNSSGRLRWTPLFSTFLRRALGVSWALAMAWLFIVAARDHRPAFASRPECGTDPGDILHAGEVLDESTLRFIIAAHCSNARYLPDGRIALRFGGAEVDVETRRVDFAGEAYYRIVSVAGEAAR